MIPLFEAYGLLGKPYPASNTTERLPYLHLSHCTNLSEEDIVLLSKKGTPISSTPDTEAHMSLGYPIALHSTFRSTDTSSNAGLGIDCHSFAPSSILLQARALLQLARAQHNDIFLKEDNFPAASMLSSTEEIFNLATIRGARSLGLENEVGSIKEGKKADLVIFDAEGSVGMLSATEFDPLVSVVRFSEAADIEFVIVDGKFRKRNRKLVDIETSGDSSVQGHVLQWRQVADRVRGSQKEIQERIEKLSMEKGQEALFKALHVDESRLVDGTV